MRRLVAVATCLVVVTSLSGCDLLFRQDHRITITAPAEFAKVPQVVKVTWSAPGFVAPQDGQFAVFVDRDPMPPGQTLGYFKPNDHRNIFIQSATTLVIPDLTPNPGADATERNHHDLTVVLLDASGARIGETSGFTEFTIEG